MGSTQNSIIATGKKFMLTRPLKAPTEPVLDFAALQDHLPMWASDKEDGIRGLICPHRGPLTGQMKPVPNIWVTRMLYLEEAVNLDGELVAIDCEGDTAAFNDTQSAIMSNEGQPRFEFRVFDCFENIYESYLERALRAQQKVANLQKQGMDHIVWLPQKKCSSFAQIQECEESALRRGKEGIMLRNPNGWYKEGRSTLNEGYLLKVKRFTDDEALVIAVEEEMENCNPAKQNERGLSQRSKHRANLKGKGMVGKLVCSWRGHIIKIGSGMTEMQKIRWWNNPRRVLNKTVTFKYQLHGMLTLPRCPIFKAIRDPRG